MKHVFIAPKERSVYLQYLEFEKEDDLALVLMENEIRKIAKCLTIAHIEDSYLSERIFAGSLKKTIESKLKNRCWNERICFILYGRIFESYGNLIVKFLRKEYRDCRVVVYFGDLISRHRVDIQRCKMLLDGAFTFDIEDAEKYGIKWILEPFSSNVLGHKSLKNIGIKWDVTFVGSAKKRFRKIIHMYEVLREAGFSCDFHITGVSPKERVYTGEISYEPLDFLELLRHVKQSYCIAEILQNGGTSPTARYAEAMLFGRNLLTDCKYFSKAENRTDSILYFDKINELKKINLKEVRKTPVTDTKMYCGMFSVYRMIEEIDKPYFNIQSCQTCVHEQANYKNEDV